MSGDKIDKPDHRSLWLQDDENNRALYRQLLEMHGPSIKAVNWSHKENQRLRFQVLTEIGVKNSSSILDVGCGTADLLVYLREHGFHGRYIGLDLTPEMVAVARKRFSGDLFKIGDVLALTPQVALELKSDFVLASGIFYYRQKEPQQFLLRTVERLYNLAEIGVAFNSLSTWSDREAENGEFRAEPLEILAACRGLSPWVALRHDYHPGDFTIYIRRHRWVEQ
jgi:SAM-dependent methyltransferase